MRVEGKILKVNASSPANRGKAIRVCVNTSLVAGDGFPIPPGLRLDGMKTDILTTGEMKKI